MKLRVLLLHAVVVSLLFAPVTRAAVSDAQVTAQIRQLVDDLYKAQKENGTWEPTERPEEGSAGHKWGGTTALVVYALITAGESYQDPRLAKGIEFLKNCAMTGVYSTGIRAHVWSALPPHFDKYLRKDVGWLAKAQHPTKGYFNYTIKASNSYDNSTTQYGVLGTWEGAKHNVPIPRAFWEKIETHFIESQAKDGGWKYRDKSADGPGTPRGSMTAAGLACLYITQDYLHGTEYRQLGVARNSPVQKKIDMGLDWFYQNFSATSSPGGGSYYYYLYGVERVGLASGVKYFKGQDWYAAGAEAILTKPGGGAVDRSFCLLFLVRGRVPVFVNKISIPDYDWNNRPRDVAKLTDWVSDESEKKMIFQTIPVDVNSERWLDAPIAYISGHKALKLTESQTANIRRFIDLGGLLITTADGASTEFTASVQQLQAQLFPQIKPAPIDAEDDINSIVFRMGSDNKLRPSTLHNGIRHLWIHLPTDVSWTLHSNTHTDPTPWMFFTNAYYYATEKGRIRPRLDSHFIARKEKGGGPAVTVGRGVYHGNWNPEPLAWEVQANHMFNVGKADVKFKDVPLDQLTATDVKFLHVAGTEAVVFTDQQIAGIKQFAANGGTILFESAGGGTQFTGAVLEMLGKAFPDNRPRPISTTLPVITGGSFNGYDVSKVAYRPYALLRMGQVDVPRLLAVTINDKPRIYVSGEDITFAMLNQPKWGVFGYTTESAQKIMTNMVLAGAGTAAPGGPSSPKKADPDTADAPKPAPAPAPAPIPTTVKPAPAPTPEKKPAPAPTPAKKTTTKKTK